MRRPSAISIVAAVLLCGCFEPQKESRMEESPRLTQTILALREAYVAFNRGDMDAAVASLDPQIEWTEPAEFPGGGTYHGRDAAKGYLTQSRAAWAESSASQNDSLPRGTASSYSCTPVLSGRHRMARGAARGYLYHP